MEKTGVYVLSKDIGHRRDGLKHLKILEKGQVIEKESKKMKKN